MPYEPNFIPGAHVALPALSERVAASAFNGGNFVDHSRFSLVLNEERGFAAATAHNIDGSEILAQQQSSRSFKLDPLITPKSIQVGNDRGYKNNPWDRGHMVRRKSMSWGDETEAAIAERESDFYSNICPQHSNLHDDAWGSIEDWMLERAESNKAACVFTGPVFTEDDPEIVNLPGQRSIQIPAGFWKIMSIRSAGNLRCAAFLVWQRDYDDHNPLSFSPVLEQVRITTIEVLTGLTFPGLRKFDPLLFDRSQDLASSQVRLGYNPASPFAPGSPLELTPAANAQINAAQAPVKRGANIFSSADIQL